MVFIPGGTFSMGSDKHYPEEAPSHRVAVDSYWIDATPVTNRQFREFVKATGHVTFAEIPRTPKIIPTPWPKEIEALTERITAGELAKDRSTCVRRLSEGLRVHTPSTT